MNNTVLKPDFNGESSFKSNLQSVEHSATRIMSTISSIADSHLELLAEEATLQKEIFTKSALLLIFGFISGLAAFLCGSFALAQFIFESGRGMPFSAAIAIVGAGWLVVAALIIAFGINTIKQFSLLPNVTLKSFKESLKCLANH